MKRRFSLFFNIATLVLCVCAIAIGVYSAKTATLNIGGSVGFVAHNCKVELSGSIQACTSSEATARTTKNITTTTIGETTDTYKLDLDKEFSGQATGGKMYFSDMFDDGKTVIVTLNIKNVSAFDITATANMPTIKGAVITVVKLGDNTITESTSINLSVNATTTLEITITLNNTDDDLGTDVSIAGTLFNFEKYTASATTPLKVTTGTFKRVTEYTDITTYETEDITRSYVTMGTLDGTAEGEKIRWFIFAQGNTEDSMTAVTGAVETNADNTLKAGTYWFISEYALEASPFGSNNTYDGSTIQTYLEGDGETSFTGTYGIVKETDSVYRQIKGKIINDVADEENGTEAVTTATAQKLWLLSVSELAYLAEEEVSIGNTYTSIIALDATSSHAVSLWWLRSPFAEDVGGAFYVSVDGLSDYSVRGNCGVRAAFQITIPV